MWRPLRQVKDATANSCNRDVNLSGRFYIVSVSMTETAHYCQAWSLLWNEHVTNLKRMSNWSYCMMHAFWVNAVNIRLLHDYCICMYVHVSASTYICVVRAWEYSMAGTARKARFLPVTSGTVPTPPIPNTATVLFFNLFRFSVPINISVRLNECNIVSPQCVCILSILYIKIKNL